MTVKRTTIELDRDLTEEAVAATGTTLRATVEQGLHLVIAQKRDDEQRTKAVLERHLATVAESIDFDVLRSGEAWR